MPKPFDQLVRRFVGVDGDLARLADPAAADALWQKSLREASSLSPTVRIALLGFFVAIVWAALVQPFWRRVGPAPGPPALVTEYLVALVFGGLLGALSGLAFVAFRRRRLRLDVWRRLVEHGLPTCLHCGYDLTGLTAPRCPERGAAAPAPPPPPRQ